MSIRIHEINTCDGCNEEIPPGTTYVDAMVYGITFHRLCWESLLGPQLAKLLNLDDIKWRIEGDAGPDGGKVIYTPNPAFHESVQ